MTERRDAAADLALAADDELLTGEWITAAQAAVRHWVARATTAEARVAELGGQVHHCPRCGKYCKQCDCWNEELRLLHCRVIELERLLTAAMTRIGEQSELLSRKAEVTP